MRVERALVEVTSHRDRRKMRYPSSGWHGRSVYASVVGRSGGDGRCDTERCSQRCGQRGSRSRQRRDGTPGPEAGCARGRDLSASVTFRVRPRYVDPHGLRRRGGPSRHHVRRVDDVSGQGAAGASRLGRKSQRPPDGLEGYQDLHVRAAQRLSLQRRDAGARQRIRCAIHRLLEPGVESPGAQHVRDSGRRGRCVGASRAASGVTAAATAGRPLRPARARLTPPAESTFLCAVRQPPATGGSERPPRRGAVFRARYRPGERS